jgi:hypothetical protein
MELGNEIRDSEAVYIKIGVVLQSPLEMMNGPLARNVIRDGDIGDSDILQHRRDNIICVDITVLRLAHVYNLVKERLTAPLAVGHQPHSCEQESVVRRHKLLRRSKCNLSRTWR